MSVVKANLGRAFTQTLTSPALQRLRRGAHALKRRLLRQAPEVHYFHQVDDPYSHLTALQLQPLQAKYQVRLVPHLVPAPDASAAPEQQKLRDWSCLDADRLALSLGLMTPDFSQQPSAPAVAAAQSAAVKLLSQPDWATELVQRSDALWRGESEPQPDRRPAEPSPQARDALMRGAALRRRWGHYLGATFYFEGEWYWGVDRLHYLEQRLNEAGLARAAAPEPPLLPTTALQFWPAQASTRQRPVIHFYCSLRSPYTYLAAAQVRRLADHYGAELRLRFVLPMVMRGLPVPLAKRLYILHDNKREAKRLGLPFGCVVDPVGEPTERGLALLHKAIALGKGPALAESFLQGVIAEGVDAGSDTGLSLIASRAGLSAADVAAALADSGWRAVAEANRADLLARGLWGVPSFRINERPAVWGQDRLWMLEQDLIQTVTAPPMAGETV